MTIKVIFLLAALLMLAGCQNPGRFQAVDADAAAGAVEEVARVVARIRARWPRTRILLRADSGFAREDLMAWCEANGVDFVLACKRMSG